MSKKNFKGFDNPALAFISNAETEEKKSIKKEVEETKIENRTKRVQLVLTPSMFENMQIVAKVRKTSVNNLICELLGKEIKNHREKIEIYKKCFSEFEKNL